MKIIPVSILSLGILFGWFPSESMQAKEAPPIKLQLRPTKRCVSRKVRLANGDIVTFYKKCPTQVKPIQRK